MQLSGPSRRKDSNPSRDGPREVPWTESGSGREDNGGAICSQMSKTWKRPADWSMEKFTLDDDMSTAVTGGVRLHEKGLVARRFPRVNWSPNLGTAVSDLEVEFVEREGLLYYFKYEVEGGGYLPVATSRRDDPRRHTVCVNPDTTATKTTSENNVSCP